MGNTLQTAIKHREAAVLVDALLPFDNLRVSEIEAYWRSFYDSAGSFAVTKPDLRVICSRTACFLDVHASSKRAIERADRVFDVFVDKERYQKQESSCDPNEIVIDALEFFAALAFAGAIPLEDKIDLLFDSWDMSEDGALDLDEFTISLKSTLTGLTKVIKPIPATGEVKMPANQPAFLDENEIDILADRTFREIAKISSSASTAEVAQCSITCEQFREYCMSNRTAKSLFDLFEIAGAKVQIGDEDENDEGDLGEDVIQLRAALDRVSASENKPSSTTVNLANDDAGDEFLAVKPWKGAILPPSKVPPLQKTAPLVSISLDWVFGYSAQTCKGNVQYCYGRSDEIVYPAAATCVVLNTQTMKQRHHMGHTDDVLSLCLHPKLPLAASGEIGKQPKIIVWDLNSTDASCILKGYHQRGILQLAFHSSELLISVGGDDNHSIGVYESKDGWRSATLKAFTKGNVGEPFHLAASSSLANGFVTCGQKYVDFWSVNGSALSLKKGLLGRKGTQQPFLVAEYLGESKDAVVVGTNDGNLYLFHGRELSSVVKAHNGAVNALHYSTGWLVSGGKDGGIVIWDERLKQIGGPFHIRDIMLTCPKIQYTTIRSCYFSPDKKNVLVGTLASEIYEIDAKSGQNVHVDALTKGHFHGEVWGLDTHPSKSQCCTVGDDQTLRIWDIELKKELRSFVLEFPARACAYSHDGTMIAVGLGADGSANEGSSAQKQKKRADAKPIVNGGFAVFKESDLSKVKEPCFDQKKWVSDIKFSPDNRVLAVASHDTKIYFYDVLKGFTRKQVFNKHSSYITHVDFSSDGNYMQSTCGGYELLFNEVKTAKQITSASTLKDERWHTMTSTLGWSVQGIWEEGSDGTDVNALDRSNDGNLVVTGDDFGKVKVFHYPCAIERASSVELRGHSSHVTNVRWSYNDGFIVSAGGNDRCVFLWRHDKQSKGVAIDDTRTNSRQTDDDRLDVMIDKQDDPLDSIIDTAGDEFMAVKPWLGAIVPPSNVKTIAIVASSPDARLELERVHGYQAQNASNNARYNSSGKIIYHSAAVGIVYDPASQRQSFFKGHDDDIVALCAHSNGTTFATAQMGKKPKIYAWDSDTRSSIACLEGFHQRFVSAICFSSDGAKLGSVGGDDDHSIAIYSWKNGILSASAKGERNNVLSIAHSQNTETWITCGVKHVRFWKEQGKNLTSKSAIFGKAKHKDGKMPATFECVVSFGEMIVVGASNGDLYVFQSSNELVKIVTAHTSNAYALFVSEKRNELISGGKDGTIMIWDAQLRAIANFDIKEQNADIGLWSSSIRSICSGSSSRIMLVGTMGSDIFEIDISRGKPAGSIIVQGHFNAELWGLACHPDKAEYCTVGDDQTVRIWCLMKKCQLRSKKLECMARACAISGPTDLLAIGYGGRNSLKAPPKGQAKLGSIAVFQYSDLSKKLYEDKPSKQPISEVKFSPNGQIMAVGSHDHNIYLYKVQENGAKIVKAASFTKHQSYITHLDFSADSQVIQSNCGAYELLFSNATTGKHIVSASSVKDTVWQSWTCVLGWPVQGIWPPFSDGTDVNAVDRNAKGDLLVTSDDFGLVKLFRYPCVVKNASSIDHRGHSSHVANVRWSFKDSYVVSVGGNDRAIMEWKVIREHEAIDTEAEPIQTESIVLEDVVDSTITDEPEGDEFMAVKPWIGAIVAPSNAAVPNSREPDLKIELEWVYGYQTEMSQQNLVYNSYGEIVYHTAAVGIIYDQQNHLQKHHLYHNDDIMSFAFARVARDVVATGERGKKPVIRVWDAHTGELRTEMTGFHARGVVSLAFSSNMKYLVSVGDDDYHSVALWEDTSNGSWTAAKLVATAKGDGGVNHFACFSNSDSTIITGGEKHVLFWSIEGKTMVSKKGKVGKKGTVQNFPCGCEFMDNFVTGTAGGDLYVWRGDEVSKIIKAHEGESRVVYSHFSAPSEKQAAPLLLSGGKDGKIQMWNSSFQSLKCFDIGGMNSGCLNKAVRSVFMTTNGQKLLIGTASSDIIEVEVANGSILHGGKPLFSGHFNQELWGLAVHPSRHQFATTGDDGTLRTWDMETKQLSQVTRLPTKGRACAYSPDASMIAVGLGGDNGVRRKQPNTKSKEGGVMIYNALSREAGPALWEDQPAKEWISDVKFSPCGTLVAFGSHDNAIYIYSISNSGNGMNPIAVKKRKPFAKHNSYITHFDFSSDSQYIQSNCGAYEYLFCDATTSEQVRSAQSVKNVVWATWTCTLGWPVQGIWPECADGTDINAVCASSSRTILATGDDSGMVKIFRYPCITKGVSVSMIIAATCCLYSNVYCCDVYSPSLLLAVATLPTS